MLGESRNPCIQLTATALCQALSDARSRSAKRTVKLPHDGVMCRLLHRATRGLVSCTNYKRVALNSVCKKEKRSRVASWSWLGLHFRLKTVLPKTLKCVVRNL